MRPTLEEWAARFPDVAEEHRRLEQEWREQHEAFVRANADVSARTVAGFEVWFRCLRCGSEFPTGGNLAENVTLAGANLLAQSFTGWAAHPDSACFHSARSTPPPPTELIRVETWPEDSPRYRRQAEVQAKAWADEIRRDEEYRERERIRDFGQRRRAANRQLRRMILN